MSDTTLNVFLGSGDAAAMAANVPDPPTPATGPDSGYVFFNTDDATLYAWDGANWVVAVPTSGGGGGLVLLEQHTASSSATLDFTTCITSTYDEYVFEAVGLVPATNATDLIWRASTDGGATYDSGSNYAFVGAVQGVGGAGTFGSASATHGATNFLSNFTNTSTKPVNGTFRLYDPLSTTLHKTLAGNTAYWDPTPNIVVGMFSSSYKSTTAMNAIRFLMASGNIASGTIRAYGVEK